MVEVGALQVFSLKYCKWAEPIDRPIGSAHLQYFITLGLTAWQTNGKNGGKWNVKIEKKNIT